MRGRVAGQGMRAYPWRMGIATQITANWDAAFAALEYSLELGATDALTDAPLNRFELPEPAAALPPQRHSGPPAQSPGAVRGAAPSLPPAMPQGPDPVLVAQSAADAAADLPALRAAMDSFELCLSKRGARNLVFADGNPQARVLILGEAPDREDDLQGRPMTGRAGRLLDAMFAAIGLSRDATHAASALYLTHILPWRPSSAPTVEEFAMMRPFVDRHIALVNPLVIVSLGAGALQGITGQAASQIARGQWQSLQGRALMPMSHPAYLLKNPRAKQDAWTDLLAIKAKLG